MLDAGMILNGSVAGLVGNATHQALNNVFNSDESPYLQALKENNALTARVLQELSERDQPDLFQQYVLTADTNFLYTPGFQILPYRRNHLMMLISTSGTVFGFKAPTLNGFQKTLATSGWYQIDLPEGTYISSSTAQTVLFKWSDFPQGISI